MSSNTARVRELRWFTMHDARAILIGLGILLASVGGLVLLNDIPPRQYPAIVAWLVIALLVHDVLIAGLVFAVAFAGRRVAGRVPAAAIIIVQCALAVGAIVALIVVPEIVKDAAGTANPSILPLNYAANLAIFLTALTVAAVAAVVLHARLARRGREGGVSGTPG
jgi:hypothetical protein